MAEALGLASSVIAVVELTTKVAGASVKLVNLWKEIKNVPVELLEKAERLRDFEDFLQETESQASNSPLPQRAWNSALLQKYISRTRAVLKDLQDMVDQLYAQVTDPRKFKSKLASTKVVLRKEDLSALDSKLNLALELFKLAREQYLTSLMSYSVMVQLQQSSEIRSIQMPQEKVASLDEADDIVSDNNTRTAGRAVAKAQRILGFSHEPTMIGRLCLSWNKSNYGLQLHAQLPSWLTGSVYSVLAQRSLCGWQLNLRSYEVVGRFDDELNEMIIRDDAHAVFKFLDDRRMTPFVRERDGQSLLQRAFTSGSCKLIQALLDSGLGPVVLEDDARFRGVRFTYPWPIIALFLKSFANEKHSIERTSSALAKMSNHGLDDFLKDLNVFSHAVVLRNHFCFRTLLHHAGRHRYQSFPIDKRLQHFWHLVDSDDLSSSEELRFMLPETENLTIDILEYSRMSERCSLFRSLAIGIIFQTMRRRSRSEPDTRSEIEWCGLLKTTLALDPTCLHHLEKGILNPDIEYVTCFARLISMIPGRCERLKSSRLQKRTWCYPQIDRYLDTWLDTLVRNQVDLLSYGRKERELYKKGLSKIEHIWFRYIPRSPPARLHLIGITFGPAKENWRFWWSDGHEEYAGEFWAMVQEKEFELKIPGSWEDEHDYDAWNDWKRRWDWETKEPLPLIWSEYRKVQAPM